MEIINFLRQFRLGGYAIFDFTFAFLGIYLLSPLLSKLFRKIRLDVPKINWLFLTLPIGILAHLIVNNITPMTKAVLDIHGHYLLKIVILICLVLGLRGIKIIPANKRKNK